MLLRMVNNMYQQLKQSLVIISDHQKLLIDGDTTMETINQKKNKQSQLYQSMMNVVNWVHQQDPNMVNHCFDAVNASIMDADLASPDLRRADRPDFRSKIDKLAVITKMSSTGQTFRESFKGLKVNRQVNSELATTFSALGTHTMGSKYDNKQTVSPNQ